MQTYCTLHVCGQKVKNLRSAKWRFPHGAFCLGVFKNNHQLAAPFCPPSQPFIWQPHLFPLRWLIAPLLPFSRKPREKEGEEMVTMKLKIEEQCEHWKSRLKWDLRVSHLTWNCTFPKPLGKDWWWRFISHGTQTPVSRMKVVCVCETLPFTLTSTHLAWDFLAF